jgi:hypothetical protein
MEVIKKGKTWFPIVNEEGERHFVKSGGFKWTFADGTVVVYMPPRTTKQYGKPVKRDASFSVTYPWGKKEGPMALGAFKRNFGEKFVNKVLNLIQG